jgi:membrane fusion protein, multidrug efflux system
MNLRHPGLSLAALLVLASAACSKPPRPERPRVTVTVAAARLRSVAVELSAIGTVTPIQSVAVRSQVGGLLMTVGFEEGQDVRSGQVLFRIDPRPYQAALDQALAGMARDRVQLANAQQQVTRYEELARTQMATREQYDQFRTNADVLAAAVVADSAAVQAARLNLEYCTLRARISGRTGGLLVREGNLVRAGDASPLVVINQLHPIAVSFAVPQQYLDDIQRFSRDRRLEAVIRPQDDTTRPMTGSLTFINNQVDSTTGTITLKATFANADDRLWPGEYVAVKLVLDVQADVLTVPAQAVMTGQAGSFVYVLNADRSARVQAVAVGRAVDDEVVIDSGLVAQQVVVTDGQMRLVPGAKVDIKGEGGAPGAGAASGRGRGGPSGAGGPPARADSGAAAPDGAPPRARPGGRPGGRS